MIFGLGLWLLVELLTALVVMGFIVAVEWPFRAMVWAIVCAIGIAWLNGINVFGWVAANPGSLFGGLAAWLFIGGASSLFFWNRYINSADVKSQVEGARGYFNRRNGQGEFVESEEFHQVFNLNKDMWRIANWVIWWPFKWVAYILGSFVTDAVKWIAKHVSGLYAHMARSRFRA